MRKFFFLNKFIIITSIYIIGQKISSMINCVGIFCFYFFKEVICFFLLPVLFVVMSKVESGVCSHLDTIAIEAITEAVYCFFEILFLLFSFAPFPVEIIKAVKCFRLKAGLQTIHILLELNLWSSAFMRSLFSSPYFISIERIRQ